MHNQSGGLVDNKQLVIFIHYVERDVLRNDVEFVARAVHHKRDDVARLDAVVRLHRFAVGKYAVGFCCLLDTVARSVVDVAHKEFVHTEQVLPLLRDKSVVFPKFLTVTAVRRDGVGF